MQITSVHQFLEYRAKIKARTSKLFSCIPKEKIEWTCAKGKFSIGDLIRHIASIERYLYAETILNKPCIYQGCGIELANGHEEVVNLYYRLDRESVNIYSQIKDEDLIKRCPTPSGVEIRIWKWLRASLEHEIHHRGQLYTYLGILGTTTPPIFGLTSEQLVINSYTE